MLFPRPASEPITVGPYTLTELIGQGGMAVVYKAKRQGPAGFEKTVVVKAMLPGLISRKELVDLFRAEAKLSAQLNHPNIVQVHDFGVAESVPFLVMEYLDGRNLTQIRGALTGSNGRSKLPGVLPLGAALAVARDMCHALGYAHDFVDSEGKRRQIIHRDVSPSNVMVCRDGMVKLLDFGVAKVAGQFESEVTQSFRGKYAYMAPEQVNRQAIDRRVDVFAAGIVLHEMLTGKRLFAGASELETLERVAQAKVIAPSVDNPDVPRKLDALVKKALSRDPSERFSSGAEMAEAIEELGAKTWTRRKLASWLTQLFPDAFTVTCEVCGKQVVPGEDCSECGTPALSQETDPGPISMPSVPAIGEKVTTADVLAKMPLGVDSQPLPLPPVPDSKMPLLAVVRTPVPDFDRPSTLESFCTLAPATDVRSFDGSDGAREEPDGVIAKAEPKAALDSHGGAATLPPLRPATGPVMPLETDYVEPASSPRALQNESSFSPPSTRRLFVVPRPRDDDSVKMGLAGREEPPTEPQPVVVVPPPVEDQRGHFSANFAALPAETLRSQPVVDLRPRVSGWKLAFALLVGGGVAALVAMFVFTRQHSPVLAATMDDPAPAATEPAAPPPTKVVTATAPVVVSAPAARAEKPAATVEKSAVAEKVAPAEKPRAVEKAPRPAPARPHRVVAKHRAPEATPKGTIKDGRIVDPFAGMD